MHDGRTVRALPELMSVAYKVLRVAETTYIPSVSEQGISDVA